MMRQSQDYSRPTTPENNVSVNANANGAQSPRTPHRTGLALTEYTANPSPPLETPKEKSQHGVPEAFLLPNGYPDV